MTSELIPYGCEMSLRHDVNRFGDEELHAWSVIGPAGVATLEAVRVLNGPLLTTFVRDKLGTQWITSTLCFHGVAPWLGDGYFPRCRITRGECWPSFRSMAYGQNTLRMALNHPEPEMQIHRALKAEYHMHVAEAWLRSMRGPFDYREINDIASELL